MNPARQGKSHVNQHIEETIVSGQIINLIDNRTQGIQAYQYRQHGQRCPENIGSEVPVKPLHCGAP